MYKADQDSITENFQYFYAKAGGDVKLLTKLLQARDAKEWDIQLPTKGLLQLNDMYKEHMELSGWPAWFIERFGLYADMITEIPRLGSGTTLGTNTMYAYDEPPTHGLPSGDGLTSLKGSHSNAAFTAGKIACAGIDKKADTNRMYRVLSTWYIHEYLGSVFSDDSKFYLSQSTNYEPELSIVNERVLGADYLKRQCWIDSLGVSVFSLTGTTGVNLITQEFGGRDKIILDDRGIPKHTLSAAGVANLVSVASSLAAREGVVGSRNPLRAIVFKPLIAALLVQPELDAIYAKMLNMFEGHAYFLRLSDFLVRLGSGQVGAYTWLRNTVLYAVKYWKTTLKAKGLPLQQLLNVINASRIYLTAFPELRQEVASLALQEQFIINVPVASWRSPSQRQRALIDKASFGFMKNIPPLVTAWDNSMITDKNLLDRAELFQKVEDDTIYTPSQHDDDEALSTLMEN
jgi:hypothetical protein